MATKIDRGGGWEGSTRLMIGRALRGAREPLTAAELAKSTGRHPSNIKKAADEMVAVDLLVAKEPRRAKRGAGRRARSAYEFAKGEKAKLESLLDEAVAPGSLRQGQQLIVASIPGSRLIELMTAVAKPGSGTQMSWAALIDGEPQECILAFDGDDAVGFAKDLMAAFSAAEVDCRRATVVQLSQGHRFLDDAKRIAETAAGALRHS